MKNELQQLYSKLLNVETKGINSIIMADALITLQKLIEKADNTDNYED